MKIYIWNYIVILIIITASFMYTLQSSDGNRSDECNVCMKLAVITE